MAALHTIYSVIDSEWRSSVRLLTLLYIVLTINIVIGQEPHAYFENSRDFVDKHDNSIICYPNICADYTVCSTHCAPLAKERES